MSNTPPKRNRALLLSNVLFALMIVAAGIVVYLYFFDNRFFNEGPELPECEGGRNEVICVVTALRAQDFGNVDLGRYTASTNQLTQPGQVIEINDLNGFLFVYPAATAEQAAADREKDAESLDADTIQITARISERPLNEGQDVHIIQHSNVIFILVGGSDSDVEMVRAAIESLP